MNDKILITGSNGQLGTEMHRLLPDAICADKDVLDITDFEAVRRFVNQRRIGTIINCAAYTAVDRAEDEPETAYKLNADAPANLAKTGCKIIHISTDYVFDGTGHKPLRTNDKAKPISVYGKTKLAGENNVLEHAQTAIIIRTAWLYSAQGNNFVKTMLKLGKQRQSLSVVWDQIGSPTSAIDLAKAIVCILPQISKENSGIYHYTNEGVCSWYDFALEIMEQSHLNCRIVPIPSAEYPTRAKRPLYGVLDKTKIKQTFNLEIPHWKESLKQCLKQF